MIITGNGGFGEGADIFCDAVVATARLDRLAAPRGGHPHEGDSYRLREHCRRAKLKAHGPCGGQFEFVAYRYATQHNGSVAYWLGACFERTTKRGQVPVSTCR